MTLLPNFLVNFLVIFIQGTKEFGSKVRQLFHRKTIFHQKKLSITNVTNKLISIKNYFLNGPQ